MTLRYKTKNNSKYYVIYFILLIVGIFAGIVELIDIPAYASSGVCTGA